MVKNTWFFVKKRQKMQKFQKQKCKKMKCHLTLQNRLFIFVTYQAKWRKNIIFLYNIIFFQNSWFFVIFQHFRQHEKSLFFATFLPNFLALFRAIFRQFSATFFVIFLALFCPFFRHIFRHFSTYFSCHFRPPFLSTFCRLQPRMMVPTRVMPTNKPASLWPVSYVRLPFVLVTVPSMNRYRLHSMVLSLSLRPVPVPSSCPFLVRPRMNRYRLHSMVWLVTRVPMSYEP